MPASSLTYNLAGGYSRFQAAVGIDDIAKPNGSVVFQVFLNGSATPAYTSGVVTWAASPKTVDLNVTGATSMRLVVTDAGDGTSWDHADWANARLTTA